MIQDVDVFDEPGPPPDGTKPKGTLRAGNKVTLLEAHVDNWCHVKGNAVPGAAGWVYDGPDYDSLQFRGEYLEALDRLG